MVAKAVFVVVFLCIALKYSAAKLEMSCPAWGSIPNCSCIDHSFMFKGPYVRCDNVRDLHDLRHRLQGIQGKPIEALQLYNASLESFPREGLFQNMHIETLWLDTSSFQSFAPLGSTGSSPFAGLENSLREIRISYLKNLKYVGWEELESMTNLYNIDINYSNIGNIGQNFSKIPPSLLYFSVLDGSISGISAGAFATGSLKRLDLKVNSISSLKRDILPATASNLTTLFLSWNHLQNLSDDFFVGMPKLQTLDINTNNLTSLPSSLQNIWNQLDTVFLSVNPYHCACNLIWLLRASKTHKPQVGDIDRVTCNSPAQLSGRTLVSLQESDLCPGLQ